MIVTHSAMTGLFQCMIGREAVELGTFARLIFPNTVPFDMEEFTPCEGQRGCIGSYHAQVELRLKRHKVLADCTFKTASKITISGLYEVAKPNKLTLLESRSFECGHRKMHILDINGYRKSNGHWLLVSTRHEDERELSRRAGYP